MLDEQLEELHEICGPEAGHRNAGPRDMTKVNNDGKFRQHVGMAVGGGIGSNGATATATSSGPHNSIRRGRWRAFDTNIFELMSAPPLAGRLLGRLCDVWRVRQGLRWGGVAATGGGVGCDVDLDLEVPVNAVLGELCHLPTCLVATDREAAQQVAVMPI